MRVHGSPIRIGGCDSTFSTMSILRGSWENTLRLRLENLGDQLRATRARSRLAAEWSGQAGHQWAGGLLRTSLIFCLHIRARSSSVAVPVSCCSCPAPLSVNATSCPKLPVFSLTPSTMPHPDSLLLFETTDWKHCLCVWMDWLHNAAKTQDLEKKRKEMFGATCKM